MDIGKLVGTVAPWIGTALGGPLGGMAVGALADALGLSDKTEAAIKNAISGATPEQMLALKKADQDFALQMQELGFKNVADLEKIAAEDRNSARNREIQTGDHFTPRLLAIVVTFGFFLVLGYLIRYGMPAGEGRDALLIMLGSLGTAWTGIVAYYFGSSAGSAQKSAQIAAQKS
ncbi:MAG: hypothetical protein Q7S99_05400 [Parvibaculum sp.]|nr:hypothetical protein [Parvibaculum sp.]